MDTFTVLDGSKAFHLLSLFAPFLPPFGYLVGCGLGSVFNDLTANPDTAEQAGGNQLPSTGKPGGTLVGMPNPSTLLPGDKILYKGKCHTVVAIKRWSDQIHGRVYALDLEARGKQVRISVVEGTELEGC